MGRGLGKIQQKVLEALRQDDREWLSVWCVTHIVYNGYENFKKDQYDVTLTESKKQSVWRAVRTLEGRGLIESRIEILYPLVYDDNYRDGTKMKKLRLSV